MENNGFRKELTTLQLTMLSIGSIIGSGVFVLTGIGIKIVGNWAPWVYLIAGVIVILNAVPTIIAGTCLPTTGGYYKYVSRLLSPTVGFYYMWTRIIGLFSVSAVVVSFGTYLKILYPSVSVVWSSIITLVILTVLNMMKIDILGNINKYVVFILLTALAMFVFAGTPNIDMARMAQANQATFSSILLCVVYYMYALDGAPIIVNMGGECKTPKKSIPIAIMFGIIISALFYAAITFIAVTATDYKTLSGAPLGEYARVFMNSTMFYTFILCGALLAILSTMNASLMVMPRILWAGAKDGIYPKWFAKLNKNGIPSRTLILVSVITALPIISGYNVSTLVAIVAVPGALMNVAYQISVLRIPKLFPNSYKESFKKLSFPLLVILTSVAIVIGLRLSLSAFKSLNTNTVIGIVVFYGIGTVYYFYLRSKWAKSGKSFSDIKGDYDQSWVDEEEKLGNAK